MSPTLRASLVRGVRTAVQAFLAVYGLPQLLAVAGGTAPVDMSLLRSAGVAGGAAILALVWRQFLDPSSLPSLTDADQATKS